MSSLRQKLNARITEPKEVAFVSGQISRREEELSALEARLCSEEEELKCYEATAKALTMKIDYAELRLVSHKRYLAELLNLKNHLDEMGGPADESETISGEIVYRQKEIATLTPKIKQMVQELHAQRVVHNASRSYLEALEANRKPVLKLISGLKAALGEVHVVPAEIWAIIFRYRLEDDVSCYPKESGVSNVRHTPLTLAHVCSFWREVVHTEKELWRYFIYSIRRISDPAQAELWKHFCSFNSGPSVLLTRLDGPAAYATNSNHAGLFPPPTSVHVLLRGNNQPIPMALPFNQANTLTVEMESPPGLPFIDGVNNAFPKATNITVICRAHHPQLHPTAYLRQVTSFKLDLTTFDSFAFWNYSHISSTEEVHILHDGINHLRQHGFEYSKVRVVGITPPDNVWMETVRFPLLRQLVLYGPKDRTIPSPQLINLSQHPAFPQIRELGLLNWPTYTPPNAASWGIMPLILAIADQLRLVETIRCADSFIEGECLVALVKRLTDTTTNRSSSNLKVVILDCCSGITRRDCELIAASVEKLIVYV